MTVLPQLENELLQAHRRVQERRTTRRRRLILRLAARTGFGQPRRRLVGVDGVVAVLGVLVVIGVAAVFLGVRAAHPDRGASTAPDGSIRLVYQAEPSPESAVNAAVIARAIALIHSRANMLGAAPVSIRAARANRIVVTLNDVARTEVSFAERALGRTAQLEIYDWEANVLTPNGMTVASQLLAQQRVLRPGATPPTILLSQGSAGRQPGAGAGGMSLYQAVRLAAKQPQQDSIRDKSRYGDQYYLFAPARSAACALAAKMNGAAPTTGGRCLLSEPLDLAATVPMRTVLRQLALTLPAGLTPADGQLLVVKQGTVVLQAAPSSFSAWPAFGSPNASYYVLKDNATVRSGEFTQATPGTDPAGRPAVTLRLTAFGRSAFQQLTAQIAKRGFDASLGGDVLTQHYAVALDNQLLAISPINFTTNPDGILATSPAQITGSFTTTTAEQLASELQLGARTVKLRLVSETTLPPTNSTQRDGSTSTTQAAGG